MEIYKDFIDPILHNQVATGLSATAALGMVGYQLRELPSKFKYLFERTLVVKLQVKSSDPSFKWIELWLSKQPYSKRATSVVLKSKDNDDDGAPSLGILVGETLQVPTAWTLSPGPGFHWFLWKGRFVWMDRSTGDAPTLGGSSRRAGPPLETIWLHTLGRSQGLLRRIVDEAITASQEQDVVGIKLWRDHYWCSVSGKKARLLETVVLKNGLKESILEDIERFSASRAWYVQRGIPWRRGYLISGPPGTGKTSFVLALAAHLKRTICVLNLGSVEKDDELFSAMLDAPSDAIILIEDIDCAVTSHVRKAEGEEEKDSKELSKITKAGLLNALDGVTTPDGRIVIMTTNYPEKLDSALIRPGRADAHFVFDYLGPREQRKMASIYFGEDKFEALPYNVSPAQMQKAFMQHPTDPLASRQYLMENT